MNQPLSFESPRVELGSANPGLRALRGFAFGMGAFVAWMLALSSDTLALPALLAALGLWLAGPGSALIEPLGRRFLPRAPALIQVWGGSLIVRAGKASRTFLAHEIGEARLYPLTRELHLRLADGKSVQLEVPAFELAEPLLDALGVPPQKRVYAARLGLDPARSITPWAIAFGGSLAATIATLLSSGLWLFSLAILPVFATILFHVARALAGLGELAVSPEGITLSRTNSQQFLHHGGLRDVRVEPHQLRICTDDGRELRTRIEGIDSAGRELIEGWVQRGRGSFATAGASTDALSALDRNGRSIAAWREALRTLLQQEGQYRRAPITADDLAQLLTSPHAPAERRIAAAFVLSQNQTASTHKQIRFAAESSSSQPMRIALRALADERVEAAAIEEALAAETGALAR